MFVYIFFGYLNRISTRYSPADPNVFAFFFARMNVETNCASQCQLPCIECSAAFTFLNLENIEYASAVFLGTFKD